MEYLNCYKTWCEAKLTEDIHNELESIRDDEEEIKSRFGKELQFGTAGMRGIMGAGTNRLNIYTVRRAARGMAAWLASAELPQKAAIAYDSRHNSKLFAEICAIAFADRGIHVFLYDRLAPTPMLSFAVRLLECGCGIVISASHNSGAYNGVKCYGPDGCQMTDAPAAIVTKKIKTTSYFKRDKKTFDQHLKEGTISYIPDKVWDIYYRTIIAESICPSMIKNAKLNVVYTPLCGTGNEPVREVLGRLGVNVNIVPCQEKPDGDFKTCEYPNPETDAALNESYKIADKTTCDLILGTDPDADRVAIAVPIDGGYKKLSGNELGCLLLDYILFTRKQLQDLPEGAMAVRSIVSTPLADRIAEKYGVTMKSVLTGFKYIGGEILELENNHQLERFVFGFEESCGYLKGTYARDKDAIVASMLVCELAAFLKLQGKTILDALNSLYSEFGYYLADVKSLELTGADAMEKAAKIMSDLRNNVPNEIGGISVTIFKDYQCRKALNLSTGKTNKILLPKSNVLEFVLGNAGSVIVRPSGTEPKVKFYFTAIGADKESAKSLMEKLKAQFS